MCKNGNGILLLPMTYNPAHNTTARTCKVLYIHSCPALGVERHERRRREGCRVCGVAIGGKKKRISLPSYEPAL